MTLARAVTTGIVLVAVALGAACGDDDACPGIQCTPGPDDGCPDGQRCTTGYLHGPCGSYAICSDGAKPVYVADGAPCDPAIDECLNGSTCPCATKVCTADAGVAVGEACHAGPDCGYGHDCVALTPDYTILRDCAGPAGTCM